MKIFFKGIKVGLTIIGTTIGAGFASGREIWEFFSSYGMQSVIGILIMMILYGLSSIFILWISYKRKTDNYYEVLEIITGKTIAKVFDVFIFLYLYSGSIIMFAGSGATFKQWEYPYILGVLTIAITVWFITARGIKGILWINSLLMPILIFILLYINYQYITSNFTFSNVYFRAHLKVWPSAVTYSALNLVSILGVLATMGKKIESKGEIIIGGVFAALVIGVVTLSMNMSLLKLEYVQQYEIPLFSLIQEGNSILLFIASLVLWISIYIAASSNVHGLVSRLKAKLNISTYLLSLILIVSLIPMSFIGFSTLIKILYPIYGVLNLYLLAVLILYPFQMTR